MSFGKGFVGKNLCLSCASHQFLWVCNSTDLDEVTPSLHCCRLLDDEFPLHLAIIVETVLQVNMFCPLPVSRVKCVFAEGEETHLARGGGNFIRDQLMLMLILWPHVCLPSAHKAEPRVLSRLGAAALGSFFRT